MGIAKLFVGRRRTPVLQNDRQRCVSGITGCDSGARRPRCRVTSSRWCVLILFTCVRVRRRRRRRFFVNNLATYYYFFGRHRPQPWPSNVNKITTRARSFYAHGRTRRIPIENVERTVRDAFLENAKNRFRYGAVTRRRHTDGYERTERVVPAIDQNRETRTVVSEVSFRLVVGLAVTVRFFSREFVTGIR